MLILSRTALSWDVACSPRSAGVGAAFMSPMMIVLASLAIWRYASARAWRKGSVASAKGEWVLMTSNCHPSPTTL